MKLDYALYALIYPLLFTLLQKVAPSLPPVFSVEVFAALFSYVLTKLGVEIVGAPVRSLLVKAGLKKFA